MEKDKLNTFRDNIDIDLVYKTLSMFQPDSEQTVRVEQITAEIQNIVSKRFGYNFSSRNKKISKRLGLVPNVTKLEKIIIMLS